MGGQPLDFVGNAFITGVFVYMEEEMKNTEKITKIMKALESGGLIFQGGEIIDKEDYLSLTDIAANYSLTDVMKYFAAGSTYRKAGFKCQLCGRKGDLNVHHNTYNSRGNENLKDLIVLCKDCHTKFHNAEVEYGE